MARQEEKMRMVSLPNVREKCVFCEGEHEFAQEVISGSRIFYRKMSVGRCPFSGQYINRCYTVVRRVRDRRTQIELEKVNMILIQAGRQPVMIP